MITSEMATSIAHKIKEQAENISFLTEVNLDTEDLAMIRSNVGQILDWSIDHNNPDVKIVASYLLMDIAMRRYDGSFWPYVSEEAGMKYNAADQGRLHDMFQDGLELMGMKKSLEIKTKRKLEAILIHTLVPDNKEYMYAFFDFISKYYKKILGYELSDDLNARFRELANFIQTYTGGSLINKIDELEDGLPNPGSLNKCTQYALTEPSLFTGLLEKIIKIIDAGYKGRVAPSLGIRRFAAPFQQWYSENIGSKSMKSARDEIRARLPHLVLRDSSDYAVALVFPEVSHCTPEAHVEFLFGTDVLTPVKQPQLVVLPGMQFPRTRQEVIYFLNRDLGHSAFKKFTLQFDGKTRFSNISEVKWKFFNENLREVQNLSPGKAFILFEDEKYDPRTDGNASMLRIRGGLYQVNLKNLEEINLKGNRYKVTEKDEDDLIGFNVECYEGVSAEIDGVRYKIARDLRVVYRASASEAFSKTAVVKIEVDSKPCYHIPVEFNRVRNTQVFLMPRDSIPEGLHLVRVRLYSDERKVGEDEFITMPGLEYNFNVEKEVYHEEMFGRLSIKYPVCKTIEFDTDQKEVSWTVPFEDREIKIFHIIPSVKFSIDGENWMRPGTNEVSFDGFFDDVIRVKCIFPVKIYVNNDPLEYIDRDDYRSFFAGDYKRSINDSLEKDHIVYFSINSKQKTRLFKLNTHNDYVFVEKDLVVKVVQKTENQMFCEITIENEKRRVTLKEGYNCLFDSFTSNARMEIIEKRDGDECVIIEKFLGDPVYMKVKKDKCVVYFNEHSVEFLCGPKEYKIAEKGYEIKKRFNPWMKENAVKKKILSLFK